MQLKLQKPWSNKLLSSCWLTKRASWCGRTAVYNMTLKAAGCLDGSMCSKRSLLLGKKKTEPKVHEDASQTCPRSFPTRGALCCRSGSRHLFLGIPRRWSLPNMLWLQSLPSFQLSNSFPSIGCPELCSPWNSAGPSTSGAPQAVLAILVVLPQETRTL